MASKTVLDRLRIIDRRLANRVNRNRLGTLQGRLYWQANGVADPVELSIFEFQDQGTGTAPWGGSETLAHRYSIQIDGDEYAAIRDLQGDYFVQPRPGDNLVAVDPESQSESDQETYVQMSFRVKQSIEHQGINLA